MFVVEDAFDLQSWLKYTHMAACSQPGIVLDTNWRTDVEVETRLFRTGPRARSSVLLYLENK